MKAAHIGQRLRHLARRVSLVVGIVVATSALLAACNARDRVQQGVAYLVGMQEYVYGFPLVMMDVTREVMTAATVSGEYKAPINQFARLRAYVDPDFKDVVRISVNSLWSHGFVDLDTEAMVVPVPDMKGRYVVVQALNVWTDVFGSAGTRTHDGKAARYLIAGPKWKGTAPPDVTQTFPSSTRFAWILVQMSASSPADYPEIHALQDQLSITPLSAWGKPYTPPLTVAVDSQVDLTATPFDQVRLMTGATSFARMAKALADSPPYAEDATLIERLKKLGVEPGKPFDATKIDPDILKGSRRAIERSAGYAVFSTFGVKVLAAGGTTGKGMVVNRRTSAETFMQMVQVQGGLGFGVSQNRMIFVFTNEQALSSFIEKGWEFGAQANLSAMSSGQGTMFSGAAAVSPGVYLYQLTQTGLAATLTVGGTKFFKDGELN